MENGNPPKKKSKKKKVRSNSPQASNGSEKQNYFCGFSSRSIRNVCEQIDNTEIQPEVYSRLAEDATYKVMEIVNNIKNYAKHSGGRATFDITNEVLKDSNCAPIIGSDDNPDWDFVEDDHQQSIFFNHEETLDLTEEFNKHITEENVNGPVFLNTTFLLDEKIDEDYIEFYNNICDSVFTGDDESMDFALGILSSSPHIAGLVKHFLIKWVDMIAVNYSNNILNRSIKFMFGIIKNPYTTNSDMNIELKHVCQLLVNLLVGSINDEIRENGHDVELEQETSEYSTYDSNIVTYDGNNGIIDNNNGMNLDEMSSDSNIKAFEESNGVLMENFSMESGKAGKSLKDELTEGFETQSYDSSKFKLENHEDASKDSASSRSMTGRNDIEDEFNALLSTNCASTIKCHEIYVESICEMMGMCASKWIGVEKYLTILIISEVENFVKINKRFKTENDFEWLGRVARGLWSLGEFAFRELLIFFEKIDTRNLKSSLSFSNSINVAAIYLRGKKDIFFYEFLQEMCGDKLIPFLLYYANFLLKINQKKLKHNEDEKSNPIRFKIPQRTQIIGYQIQRLNPPMLYSDLANSFNGRQPSLRPFNATRPIIIQYGHPVSTKKQKKTHAKTDEKREIHQNVKNLQSFNQRIVIAKGRLRKPITNIKRTKFLDNFHTLTI
ncbi:CLUMA_CG011799, isoform A [Clunio marinus]|uniref:CLUMA_CG011799, isoform A n=1 Tax=Clunio marinus TaxID=568069 RepID=A0A1J1IFB5_9DIPT|nr:CLUMA_CG011799, isoform A [Clunio marinus]